MAKRTTKRGARKVLKGPKPKPPEKVRSRPLTVMLTPPEYDRVVELADEQEIPPGTLAYKWIVEALRSRS